MEDLLRRMIHPDPAYRISAMQAYHHPALHLEPPSEIITPHFVRAAATFEEEDPLPNHAAERARQAREAKDAKKADEKKRRRRRKEVEVHVGAQGPRATTPTPTALGESIKQHTSIGKPKVSKWDKGVAEENEMPSPSKAKMVIKTSGNPTMLHNGRGGQGREDVTRELIQPCEDRKLKDV
jgi:protein-serine/threonine kinase